MSVKIVMVGAGSKDFGRGNVVDIMRAEGLRGQGVTLCLHDINESALDLMYRFAEIVKAHLGADIAVTRSLDREQALTDANFVICAVERSRMPLWEQDFRVPHAFSFRHILGENGGPGAMFHALRNMNIVIPICRDMERICPTALLLDFTNPVARITHAVSHLTKIKVVGLCHGIHSGTGAASQYLGRPLEELEIVSAGLNHFYMFLSVKDKETGEDLLPKVIEGALADEKRQASIYHDLVKYFNMFTYRSDDHIGEYLAWGASYVPDRWSYGQECHAVKPSERQLSAVECVVQAGAVADESWVRGSGEAAVDIINAQVSGVAFDDPAVNVLNSAGYVANLPKTAVVEVPATVDADGLHPHFVGCIPEPAAALMRVQFSIIDSLTEAFATKSRDRLMQALLLDPVVDSVVQAEKMLDYMLQLQADFLPSFT
ncbi:MAG: family 4 glycosyl hydrolase [Armatimonadota bacterium]